MFVKPSIKSNSAKVSQTDKIIIRKDKRVFINYGILAKYNIRNFKCCNILADYDNFKIILIFCDAITYGYFVRPYVKLFGIIVPIMRVLKTFRVHSFLQSFPIKFECQRLKSVENQVYKSDMMKTIDMTIIFDISDMAKFIDFNDPMNGKLLFK